MYFFLISKNVINIVLSEGLFTVGVVISLSKKSKVVLSSISMLKSRIISKLFFPKDKLCNVFEI